VVDSSTTHYYFVRRIFLRVLAVGDIVGNPGYIIVKDFLSEIKKELDIDFCIANGENAATGNGITRSIAHGLFDSGVDVITMGNHVWSKRDIFRLFEDRESIIRPINYPIGTPGRGYIIAGINDKKVAVINAIGRVYLDNLDCPFRVIENELKTISKITNIIIVDFHAEATSEKIAMGWFLDGKVSAVFGTHTHVQTADERILPRGTAYITDIGMTGPHDSILGVRKDIIIGRFIHHMPQKFEIAEENVQLSGIVFEIDEITGKATSIHRVNVKQ
jgi:metallophosphoesterase (TIGR00282 family)